MMERAHDMKRLCMQACVWWSVTAGSAVALPDSQRADFDAFRSTILAVWPKTGSIIAEYAGEVRLEHIVRYDFSSGAWYRLNHSPHWWGFGEPASKEFFQGNGARGAVKPMKGTFGGNALLDNFFPTLMLHELLTRYPEPDSIERRSDGGWRVTWSLPRGERHFAADELPTTEVQRLGGPDKVLRPMIVEVDRTGRVLASLINNAAAQYDTAECSLPGFQVCAVAPPMNSKLVSCRYRVTEPTEPIGIVSVERELVSRVAQDSENQGEGGAVGRTTLAVPSLELSTNRRDRIWRWVIYGGIGLIVLAVGGALWRRRA